MPKAQAHAGSGRKLHLRRAAAQLAPATGVSEVLLGSVVTYHPEVKQQLLGVKKTTLATYSAESQQTTNEMALGLHRQLPAAGVYVAVTGLCGPGKSETSEKPVGTVFVTILFQGKAHEYREQFTGTGDAVRQRATEFIYEKLLMILSKHIRQHSKPKMQAPLRINVPFKGTLAWWGLRFGLLRCRYALDMSY
ncbi:CinA family protein [Hymenobacter rigui]|uniref:CinA family protein n=1 Tax=Hymenobacter rigui TaxID=334424 RepID=UPI001F0C2700|nr:nicotinamide-nucleotide amidohydrolase family protein [Hymenobacter rigui]